MSIFPPIDDYLMCAAIILRGVSNEISTDVLQR